MDNNIINNYLENVNRQLKHLTISEKTDIINEIKSHILEMQMKEGITIDTILQNLGDPADLAKSYVEGTLANTASFNFKNLIRIISFYGKTGLSGAIVIPFLSVLSASLYLCSFLVILAGIIKTGGTLLGYEVPFIIFNFGFWTVPGLFSLPVSIPFALLFYYCSKKLWQLLKSYLVKVTTSCHSL